MDNVKQLHSTILETTTTKKPIIPLLFTFLTPTVRKESNTNDLASIPLQFSFNTTDLNDVNEFNNTIAIEKKSLWEKLFEFMPLAETKEFKTSYTLNPVVAQQLNAFLAFGRTKQPCGDSIASNIESTDSGTSSSSAASSSAGTASVSSSGSVSSSSSASSSSSSSQSSFSSSDENLPTNEQFYPIFVSESQTNDDIHNSQQYYDEQQQQQSNFFDKFGHAHKKTWDKILHAPGHAIQKVRKFGADLIGLGPFYGSDHFADKFTHRKVKL